MFSDKVNELENRTMGIVFNIERYHLHDGEGIRSNVFLKGCNLSCPWCCNPESINPKPEIALHRNLCTRCYTCVEVCPSGSRSIDKAGNVTVNRDRCENSGICVEKCPNGAIELYGEYMSVAQVVTEVERDMQYYINSGGGVTLSGGEACLQPVFAREILMACKRRYIHTALETAAAIPWKTFWKVAEYVDEILMDIKTTDARQFAKISPVPLELVKENLVLLRKRGKNVTIRCPIIPKFNDSEGHIDNVVRWAREADVKDIDLLPFHHLGRHKYQSLEREYKMIDTPEMDRMTVEKMAQGIREQGFNVTVGG